MQDQFSQFTTKKNLASLLVLAILVLAIPLGVNLVRQQQILKSRASGEQINFASPGIDQRTAPNGSPVTVALDQTVGLNIGLPDGWSYTAVSPSVTPSPVPLLVYAELVRYYSFGKTDNWSTTSLQNTNYPNSPATGYSKSESQGYILAFDDGLGDVAPLYDCLENNSKKTGDHSEEVGACSSGTQTKIGYIYKSQQTNSTAIHRCFDTKDGDSFLFIGAACNSKYADGGDVLVGYSLNSIPSSSSPTPSPSLSASPIAEWKLDEGSGTAITNTATNTAGTNNGTYVGGNPDPIWKSGSACVSRGCLQFWDAAKDFVNIPDTNLRPTKYITISVWAISNANNTTWNTFGWFVSNRTNVDGNGYNMHPWAFSKSVTFYVGIGGKWIGASAAPTDITKWHHYVGTYDGSYIKLYIDGAIAKSTPAAGDISYNGTTNHLTIGKDDDEMPSAKNRWGNGNIDEVRIYDKALSDSEVTDLYGSYGYPHP